MKKLPQKREGVVVRERERERERGREGERQHETSNRKREREGDMKYIKRARDKERGRAV